MKLPRKWSKIGLGLLLAGVIGFFLELLFGIPEHGGRLEGYRGCRLDGGEHGACVQRVALLQWKCKCPHCGRWSAAAVARGRKMPSGSPALRHPAGI